MNEPDSSRTPLSVGPLIASARRKAGLSQTRLANRLHRCQSYVAKIEGGGRGVGLREFIWIVQRIGEDPMQLLEQLCRGDSFSDLEHPEQRHPWRRDGGNDSTTRHVIEAYDPADEVPDDDESELGHLTFGPGGAE